MHCKKKYTKLILNKYLTNKKNFMNKCIYCGSENLEKELPMRGSKSIGNLHFNYANDARLAAMFATENEIIFADLCNDCGSITRFYVKNTKRFWNKSV